MMERKVVFVCEYWIEDEEKLLAAGRKASIGSKYYSAKEEGAPLEEHTVTQADYDEEGLTADERCEARTEWMEEALRTLHPILTDEEQEECGLSHYCLSSKVEPLNEDDKVFRRALQTRKRSA